MNLASPLGVKKGGFLRPMAEGSRGMGKRRGIYCRSLQMLLRVERVEETPWVEALT